MKIFYLRDKHKRPVTTVAYELTDNDTVINFATATCNPLDQFRKGMGVHIACTRLAIGKYHRAPLDGAISFKRNIIITIILATRMVATGTYEHGFPQRARDAAQLWLKANDPDYLFN